MNNCFQLFPPDGVTSITNKRLNMRLSVLIFTPAAVPQLTALSEPLNSAHLQLRLTKVRTLKVSICTRSPGKKNSNSTVDAPATEVAHCRH